MSNLKISVAKIEHVKNVGFISLAILLGAAIAILGERAQLAIIIIIIGLFALIFAYAKIGIAVAAFLGVFLVIQQPLESVIGLAKYGDEALVLLLFGIVLLRNWVNYRKFVWRVSPIDKYLVIFIVLSVISAVVNHVPAIIAARGLYATLKGILMFYILWNLRADSKMVKRFYDFMIAVALILSILALAVTVARMGGVIIPFIGSTSLGVSAIFNHRATLAYFVAFFLSFVIADIAETGRLTKKFAVQLVILGTGLVMAVSRAAWFATVVSVGIHVLRIRSRRILQISIIVILVLSIGISIASATSNEIQENLERKASRIILGFNRYILGTYQDYSGIDWRMITTFEGLNVLKQTPLLGVGPGRFGGWVAFETNTPVYEEHNVPILGRALRQSDNFWIHLLVESGIPGFIVFVLLLREIYRGYRQIYFLSSSSTEKSLALGAMISFVIIIIVAFFSPTLEGRPMPFYFWGTAGAVLALGRSPEN